MTSTPRGRELARSCDVLEAAPADAPTLCTGWTAYDIAAHVWIFEHDPLGGRAARGWTPAPA